MTFTPCPMNTTPMRTARAPTMPRIARITMTLRECQVDPLVRSRLYVVPGVAVKEDVPDPLVRHFYARVEIELEAVAPQALKLHVALGCLEGCVQKVGLVGPREKATTPLLNEPCSVRTRLNTDLHGRTMPSPATRLQHTLCQAERIATWLHQPRRSQAPGRTTIR